MLTICLMLTVIACLWLSWCVWDLSMRLSKLAGLTEKLALIANDHAMHIRVLKSTVAEVEMLVVSQERVSRGDSIQ